MLGQRQRRWPSIEPGLDHRLPPLRIQGISYTAHKSTTFRLPVAAPVRDPSPYYRPCQTGIQSSVYIYTVVNLLYFSKIEIILCLLF